MLSEAGVAQVVKRLLSIGRAVACAERADSSASSNDCTPRLSRVTRADGATVPSMDEWSLDSPEVPLLELRRFEPFAEPPSRYSSCVSYSALGVPPQR